jgi:NhaA family Na+:H+ antiporter
MIKHPKIRRVIKPIEHFLALESASGILLAAFTVIALFIANSGLNNAYQSLLHTMIFGLSLQHWINDGLMAIFFFVVGMEIKRELVSGELASVKKAALPIAAALGGMIGPALIYFSFNPSGAALSGWGIPMATDIAFAVGVLSFFRVPLSLKVFLLALAIVDDLGAVLVIALFYTKDIAAWYLVASALVILITLACRFWGVRAYAFYILLGVAAWFCVLKSGVHATVAGVIMGLITPLRLPESDHSPLEELVTKLHPWMSFAIMPIFAIANAGVSLVGADSSILSNPILQGVSLGLFFGKPAGILLACFLTVKLGLAQLPSGVAWGKLSAVAFLGGIGFTMALFISNLALPLEFEIYSKSGILLGSVASAIVGALLLKLALRSKA